MLKNIGLALIPLFVAVDAVGVLPIFVSFTEGVKKRGEKLRIITESVITATLLTVTFIFIGVAVFKFLKITVGDFMVAGGSVLFCLAITDIMNPVKKRQMPAGEMGAVPLGTPLIAGPAVLTTSLMCLGEYGTVVTLIAVIINVLLAGVIFACSGILIRILGTPGTRALSKIMSLLLAAIAVMMVRKGVYLMLNI